MKKNRCIEVASIKRNSSYPRRYELFLFMMFTVSIDDGLIVMG